MGKASVTPAQAAQGLRRLRKELRRPIVNAFRRGLTRWKKRAVDTLRTRGVGRALWGAKPKGARLMIKRTRIIDNDSGTTGGLRVRGLAALQETGGRTAPHKIKAKNAKALVFLTRSGKFFKGAAVQHPGSNIPAIPFLRQTGQATVPELVRDMDAEIQKLADSVI